MFSSLWNILSNWSISLTSFIKPGSNNPVCDETAHIQTEVKNVDIIVSQGNETVSDLEGMFYGICLPTEIEVNDNDLKLVVNCKKDALDTVTKYKGARFKRFQTFHEAENFSLSSIQLNSQAVSSETDVSVEKATFKAPERYDLMRFRKYVETGDCDMAKTLIWDNPRYLVSGGDTPTVLQEGFRYHALHIAAKNGRANICQLVVESLNNPNFFMTLYPNDSLNVCERRMKNLTDLYLNLPDGEKGNNETCLHFATKFGHLNVVKYLLSQPVVDRSSKNKYGETALEISCSRVKGSCDNLKNKIADLFEERLMIPLLRSNDDSAPPKIGKPCNLDELKNPISVNSPLSPKDPVVSVKAYAGPMSPVQAISFHKQWTTPPSCHDKISRNIRKEDIFKGQERIARTIAHNMEVPWYEYWDFLGEYCDISTEQGLFKLDKHLQQASRQQPLTYPHPECLSSPITSVDNPSRFSPEPLDVSVKPSDISASPLTVKSPCDAAGGWREAGLDGSFIDESSTSFNSPDLDSHRQTFDFSFTSTLSPMTQYVDVSLSNMLEKINLTSEGAACCSCPTFIYGPQNPTKADIDVYRAITHLHIDQQSYPFVHSWKKLIESFSDKMHQTWCSPARLKNRKSKARDIYSVNTSELSPLVQSLSFQDDSP